MIPEDVWSTLSYRGEVLGMELKGINTNRPDKTSTNVRS
jgi:hypothetical protein